MRGTPADWTDAYYGDLYLESAADLMTPALTALEAGVIARLLAPAASARLLDLACGHGRHAWALAGVAAVVGVDRSRAYLARAEARGPAGGRRPRFIRADLRALPFPDGAFDGAYSWYSSLFMWSEEGNAAALAELARVVRRGGRVLVHHANPLRLARQPRAIARRVIAGGAVVEEEAEFDPTTGVERAHRRLVRPGGARLEGTAVLRYYRPEEWHGLARGAGLRLLGLTSTPDAAAGAGGMPGPEAPDLVALLERAVSDR
ncbi:MAG TPA: class I SAM-dependent methyltransferase [Anaeromyxobacter sp.]|nr:class I SAM-dependent methyltransferase [Anaeromyxobacter sp.]